MFDMLKSGSIIQATIISKHDILGKERVSIPFEVIETDDMIEFCFENIGNRSRFVVNNLTILKSNIVEIKEGKNRCYIRTNDCEFTIIKLPTGAKQRHLTNADKCAIL